MLDLGAGKGGDLKKWYYAHIKFLWAVEPNRESLEGKEGFRERLAGIIAEQSRPGKKSFVDSFGKNVRIINTGAENSAEITRVMIDKPSWMEHSQAEVVSFLLLHVILLQR